MTDCVIGLFSATWSPPPLNIRDPLARFRRLLRTRAASRDSAYMEDLFLLRFPNGRFIDIDREGDWADALIQANTVVLLYPDAIGQGFGRIESVVRRRSRVPVIALNGRRRKFALDSRTRRALWLRRRIELWMLGELFALGFFLIVTPVLLAIDLVRGRT